MICAKICLCVQVVFTQKFHLCYCKQKHKKMEKIAFDLDLYKSGNYKVVDSENNNVRIVCTDMIIEGHNNRLDVHNYRYGIIALTFHERWQRELYSMLVLEGNRLMQDGKQLFLIKNV